MRATDSKLEQLSPSQQEGLIAWYLDLADWLAARLEAEKASEDATPTTAEKTEKISKKAKKISIGG